MKSVLITCIKCSYRRGFVVYYVHSKIYNIASFSLNFIFSKIHTRDVFSRLHYEVLYAVHYLSVYLTVAIISKMSDFYDFGNHFYHHYFLPFFMDTIYYLILFFIYIGASF